MNHCGRGIKHRRRARVSVGPMRSEEAVAASREAVDARNSVVTARPRSGNSSRCSSAASAVP